MMKQCALQLQYTSCRTGVRGGKGFQTRALSADLRTDEQREIEAQGGYSPPRDAAGEPSWEEIERDFPVLFRFYRLASGRYAVTRSQYTGRDYSERWGNFFAHTLVLDDWPPAVWPIDYYEWPGWKRRLEPAEDTEILPEPLPAAVLDDAEPSSSFTFEELQAFLRESPGRTEMLAAMIRAVFFGRTTARALVVRDSPLNGAFWIACVQKAFPLRHALTLTQSTYQFDSRDCAALNATTNGTDFTFDETQRKFQFCMFDFVEGVHSEIPAEALDYAATMANWMAEQPHLARAFHAFMAEVDHDAIGPELPQLLSVFRMCRGDVAGITLPAMVDALHVTVRHVAPVDRGPLFGPLAEAAVWAVAEGTPEQVLSLLSALGPSAEVPAPLAARAPLAQTWLRCFETTQKTRRWSMLPTLAESRDALAALAPDGERRIAMQLLSAEERAGIAASLATIPPESPIAIEWLIGEVLRSARSAGMRPDAEPVQAIVAAAGEGAVRDRAVAVAVLRAFGTETNGLAAACATLARGSTAATEMARCGEPIGRALYDVMRAFPQPQRTAVRRALDREETWPVLFGDWLAALEANRGRREFYVEYCESVLRELPGFNRSCRGGIARTFADSLDARARGAAALTWLRVGEIDRFPLEIQRWCVTAAAATLPIAPDGGGPEAARLVAERARHVGVELEPDRAFLRLLLERAAYPQVTIASLNLVGVQAALRGIQRAEYVTFLTGFLRPALAGADEDDHEAIVRAAFVPAEAASFTHAYAAVLAARGRDELSVSSVTAALRFWLPRMGDGGIPGSGTLNEPALKALVTRLARMSRADFDKVRHRVAGAGSPTPALAKWRWIEKEVERRNRSILTRARDLLRRDGS